jgi:hypothetical protein
MRPGRHLLNHRDLVHPQEQARPFDECRFASRAFRFSEDQVSPASQPPTALNSRFLSSVTGSSGFSLGSAGSTGPVSSSVGPV